MFNVNVQSENRSFQEIEIMVTGELDSVSAWDFYDFLNELEQKGFRKFILNFAELNSLSSAGISVLFRLKKKFQENNSAMVFIHLGPELKELFNFFGFHRTFLLSNDKESAEKLLESIYFLRYSEPARPEPVNRFVIVEEPQEEPLEYAKVIEKTGSTHSSGNNSQVTEEEDIIHFGDFDPEKLETQIEEIVKEYDTIPKLEDIPYIEEIATEPFLSATDMEDSEEDSKDSVTETNYSIPFVTKSYGYDKEAEIANSILLSSSPSTNTEEFNPLIINCGKCGLKIRVVEQGIHKCPSCSTRFNIRQSGSISTIENL